MNRSDTPSWRDIVRGYLVLPHATPIIVVMSATAAFALVAAGGWPGLDRMLLLMGAMFGGQLAIGALNELVDAELDAISKPEKPIPAGLVTRHGAWMVVGFGLVLMTACSLSFGVAALLLCTLGTGSGLAYSLWFKQTMWSWIPYLVALPLLPIWVWTALETVDPGLFAIYPIGAVAVIGVQLAQSIPDIEGDEGMGVRTLAVALGEQRARIACWSAMILGAGLASALAPVLTSRPLSVWAASLAACGLVGANALVWRRNARKGALACFPCVAAGAALLGIGWTMALFG